LRRSNYRGAQEQIKAAFAGTICSTPFLKPFLFEHGREAHSPEFVEVEFSEVGLPLYGVLGSCARPGSYINLQRSLQSNAGRKDSSTIHRHMLRLATSQRVLGA
jgi:hypothetical protein